MHAVWVSGVRALPGGSRWLLASLAAQPTFSPLILHPLCPAVSSAGPLEATIANLQRELAARAAASRDLQRRWISVQGALVGLQADNAELAEAVAAMRAQQAVMQQKRARLNGQ